MAAEMAGGQGPDGHRWGLQKPPALEVRCSWSFFSPWSVRIQPRSEYRLDFQIQRFTSFTFPPPRRWCSAPQDDKASICWVVSCSTHILQRRKGYVNRSRVCVRLTSKCAGTCVSCTWFKCIHQITNNIDDGWTLFEEYTTRPENALQTDRVAKGITSWIHKTDAKSSLMESWALTIFWLIAFDCRDEFHEEHHFPFSITFPYCLIRIRSQPGPQSCRPLTLLRLACGGLNHGCSQVQANGPHHMAGRCWTADSSDQRQWKNGSLHQDSWVPRSLQNDSCELLNLQHVGLLVFMLNICFSCSQFPETVSAVCQACIHVSLEPTPICNLVNMDGIPNFEFWEGMFYNYPLKQ